MTSIRKKVYTQAYFLIKNNWNYSHSFGVRLMYVGMNGYIAGLALFNYFWGFKRLRGAHGEIGFDWNYNKKY